MRSSGAKRRSRGLNSSGQKGERADQRGDRQNLGATCAKTVGEKSEATQIRRRHRWQHHGPIEYGAGNQGPQATRPRCDPQTCQKTPEPDDWINVRLVPDGCIDVQLCASRIFSKISFGLTPVRWRSMPHEFARGKRSHDDNLNAMADCIVLSKQQACAITNLSADTLDRLHRKQAGPPRVRLSP